MEFRLDGYCGLYCGACPNMLGTQAGTQADPCYGCKSEHPAGHCANCGIKTCARDKGYEFCDECAELRTCEKIHQFMVDPHWPYHQSVIQNLESMRRVGVTPWLDAQAVRWRCTHCGAAHSWWDEVCPQCGQAVASYKADL